MKAAVLTEQITIQKPITIKSDTGSESIDYEDVITCRARVVFNSGTRLNENGDMFFTNNITFHIRRFYQFNELYRIRWNGHNYRITAPIEHNKPTQSIIIQTELINDFELND